MYAKHDISRGRELLAEIIAQFPAESPHWNEAQNRFQFVDRLLLECLGWSHPDVQVERHEGGGLRSDYVLGTPPKAVLEAKKEEVVFKFPAGTQVKKTARIKSIIEFCKSADAAVKQVLHYCVLNGAQLAVVCNGPQMIIFQSIVPGSSPLDGECFVFNGVNDYVNNFDTLWNLISPEAITENRAYRELSLKRNPRLPQKASTALSEPYRYRYRSNFQEDLRTLSSILLEDILDQDEVKRSFYKECYVPIEANNRNLLLSKNIISSRYSRVSDNGIQSAALGADIEGGKLQFSEETSATLIGSRPIVVIGDVGVGKTSFFENLFIQLSEQESHESYIVNVNLGISASLTDNIRSHVMNSISKTLRDQYDLNIESMSFVRSVYYKEIEQFEMGIYGALKNIDPTEYEKKKIEFLSEKVMIRDQHLLASLGHISKGRNKQIILVIDNADQRDYETQQTAFLIAQELAATRNMIVFVAVRPSTFYQSKLSGALSGYQNRVLTISPPPADEVIRKRIGFAVRVAEGEIAPTALEGIKFNLGSVVSFLKATLRSIRSNEQIKTFLSNITGGNTRSIIELITGFCGSPNVESEKIVNIENQTGSYKVPLHEFAKHALLGEYAYYNPMSSQVAFNLFDVSFSDPKEHFLCSLIVSLLSSSSIIKDKDGFVSGSKIVQDMSIIGFVPEQTYSALRRLASKRLIETPHAHFFEIDVPETESGEEYVYRCTTIGMYHVRNWIGNFSYIDAMSIDTPIFDDDVRGLVFVKASSFEISDRLIKAEAFSSYLEAQWHLCNLDVNYFDFSQLLKAQKHSFEAVKNAVQGGNRRRRGR